MILRVADGSNESNFYNIKLEAFWQNNKANLVDFSIDQASGTDSTCFFEYLKSFVFNDVCFTNKVYEFKRGFELNPIFVINNDFLRKDPERIVAKISQINKWMIIKKMLSYSKTLKIEGMAKISYYKVL